MGPASIESILPSKPDQPTSGKKGPCGVGAGQMRRAMPFLLTRAAQSDGVPAHAAQKRLARPEVLDDPVRALTPISQAEMALRKIRLRGFTTSSRARVESDWSPRTSQRKAQVSSKQFTQRSPTTRPEAAQKSLQIAVPIQNKALPGVLQPTSRRAAVRQPGDCVGRSQFPRPALGDQAVPKVGP